MVWQLRKCTKCGVYTLNKESCPVCGGAVKLPHPAKFSPDDKYFKYRMAAKMSQEKSCEQNEANLH